MREEVERWVAGSTNLHSNISLEVNDYKEET